MTDLKSLGIDDWLARAAALQPQTDAFIDGRFVPAASGRTFADIGPRDGRAIADVALSDATDVDRAVTAARASFEDRRWADQSPKNRKRVLLRLAELIRADREGLALIESLDVGKPIRDTLAVDVPSCATTFQWYAEAIDKVYGEIGPTGPEALSLVTREPVGVVAAIVPWNYPLIITAWRSVRHRRRGSVVLKLRTHSPVAALQLPAAGAGRAPGVLNVPPGWARRSATRCAASGIDKGLVHGLSTAVG
jgi:acyl-CoA reductase-like NAD-dependent aldehyde dehydrogenase